MIHPTAEIAEGAEIASDVEVGPFCHIGKDVTIASGVTLAAHVTLEGGVSLDKNTHLYAFVHIGNDRSTVTIGEGCNIREFATIGTLRSDDLPISIGSHCYIMGYADIRSGVRIDTGCTITNTVLLDRQSYCQEKVIVGAKASVAAGCTIGRGSMIGGVSAVQSDIPPYCLVEGYPNAEIRGLNLVGMRRGFEDRNSITEVKKAFMRLKKSHFSAEEAKTLFLSTQDIHARQFIAFVATHSV